MANIFFCKFPLEDSLAGAEFHTLKLAKHFVSRGHTVQLLSSDKKLLNLFAKNNLPHRYIFVGWEPTSKLSLLLWPITYLVARSRFEGLTKDIPPHSAIFMQSLTEKLLLTPRLAASQKIFWLEHKTPGRWLKSNPLLGPYLKLANQIKLIAVSNFAEAEFVKLGVQEKNIGVIYPGISLPSTQSPPASFTIGILSRLDPEKGVFDFLKKIIPHLPSHSTWQILIGGEGKERGNIEQLINNNNLQTQIQLLGFVENVSDFFSQISVFVYPTLVPESFGIAAAEAQARGIPVIASSLGALPEIIDHQKTGFLVAPENAQAWIGYLENMAKNKSLCENISFGAKNSAKRFNQEKMFAKYDELMEQI